MKKLFITAAIATMFSVTAFAKAPVTGEENISYAVLNHFNADFKNAKMPAWTVPPTCQKVTFILDGAHVTAFYNLSGDYLGTTQDVDFKAIPETAQTEITKKYSGYTVAEVIKYESDGSNPDVSTLAYFVDLKKADSELLVKVIPGESVSFFKKVK